MVCNSTNMQGLISGLDLYFCMYIVSIEVLYAATGKLDNNSYAILFLTVPVISTA